MFKSALRVFLLFVYFPAPCMAQVSIDGKTTITLATAAQGRAILGKMDGYVTEQSPWERDARMGVVGEATTAAEYQKFAAEAVLDWTGEERTANLTMLKDLATKLAPYAAWFPREVLLVKTTGREDYGGAYTRQNAVVLKGSRRGGAIAEGMLAHELWHVVSRHNPELRDKIYKVIGFEYCGPLHWPAALDRLRLTNPDCPINQHWIKIKYQGQDYHAMPIITAKTERFGIDTGASLGFLNVRLLMVKKTPDGKGVEAVMKDGKPLEANFDAVENLYEQLGHNTDYLFHPEEWIADNFSMLVMGRSNVPSPEILEKMKAVLLAPATAANR